MCGVFYLFRIGISNTESNITSSFLSVYKIQRSVYSCCINSLMRMEMEHLLLLFLVKQNIKFYICSMITQKIELPKKLSYYLINLPENGMGYQIVKVILKSGKVLRKLKVLNSSVLVLDKTTNINSSDIEKIELE